MRICHACHRELDEPSLAAGRCAHCGTAIPKLAERTILNGRRLRRPGKSDKPSDEPPGKSPSDESVDIELAAGPTDATIEAGDADTAGGVAQPEGKPSDQVAGPDRKTPTVPDRSDVTAEFQPSADVASAGGKPTDRSTHTLESDLTIEFGAPLDPEQVQGQWRGTVDPSAEQSQTIRQKETVTGFRSSLPVKPRYVREKREAASPLHSPAEVPDYELLDILGEGGMGVVYAAHQSSIARTVAVKMLKPAQKTHEEQRDKFISEAVVTGELDHPNIVPIYELGTNDEGALFYSMKRVRGTPWNHVIREKQLAENLSILMRVADAVAFAHAGGVIHRDLKPENIMLGDYGEVLVMDWGLARVTPEFANVGSIYQTSSLGGTPAYMAPEMASGPIDRINRTSDVYLLGAILYEIVGGAPPHSGHDVMDCLSSAAQNRINPIHYEGELKDVALRAMATRPEDRFQTVKEFQEAIRVYQSHSESLVLTAHAQQNLGRARQSGDYQQYARAQYGFQEALALWDANERARSLLAEAQHDYAECALGKGDFDLAASLLDAQNAQHAALLKRVEAARAERDARQRRLRLAKQTVAALAVVVVATVSTAYFQVRASRNEAVRQKDLAVVAEAEAVHQKDVAEQQRQEAVRQKEIADTQRQRAEEQTEIAVQERQRAEEQRQIAVQQRQVAEDAKQAAENAKQAEEYEAYVARIGLAAAKIHDNAYDYALELLQQCRPELRNWEWGRLMHLCQLAAASFEAAGPVDAVAYSPDGKSLVSGDWSGQVTVRDVATGAERFTVTHGQYVLAVAYSPDGRQIATGSSDHTIRILNADDGAPLRTLEGHTDGVLSVSFSPDGRQLLSGSYDNTARLWDLDTGQVLQVFRGHNWWVWATQFSPDGRRIVTAGQDGKAIVWEERGVRTEEREEATLPSPRHARSSPLAPRTYEELTEFTGHEGAVYSARFSPDGKLVATGGYDKLVMVWNPDEVQPVDIRQRLDGGPAPKTDYLRLAGHDGPVRSVSFSPNGELVLSGSEDNTIRLWDIAAGENVKTLRGHGSAVRACQFSPDGKWVLSGGQDQRVRLWDVAGYQEVRALHTTVLAGHADAVLSARFSPSGRRIVTASRDRTASLWDAATGQRLRQFEEGHEFLATSAVFLPGSQRLATSAGDNSVRIWDLSAGTQLTVLQPTGRIGTLAVSPDGDWLATGAPGNDATVWDANSGQPVATLIGHAAEVSAVAFSPDGILLATGDDRGRVRLWRRGDLHGPASVAPVWTLAHELDGHSRTITAMRFAPDGSRLLTASGDHTCGQWDVASGQEMRQLVLKHPDWVSALDISADGTLALTACDDGAVRLWRLADAKVIGTLQSPAGIFNAVSFSPDGRTALVTSSADRQVKLWNPAANQNATETLLDFNKLGGLVWSAMFAPDGRYVLTIGGNDAELWDIQSRRPVVRLSPHGAVASATLSPDERLVVTGSWDHSAKIWDAATGRAIRRLDGGHTGYINTAEFSPDGTEILTASDDGTARLWDVASGRASDIIFRGHGGRVLSAAYSPDAGRVLTASGDKTARIWDHATGRSLLELKGHGWAVLCGQFSRDGRRVITGSEDNAARIWNAQTGQSLLTLAGHTAAVTSVAFSPDGTRAVTASRDNTAKLWDALTGKEILSLAGHSQEVTSVAFSPDGRYVLTGSRDGTAIIWLAIDWHTSGVQRMAGGR